MHVFIQTTLFNRNTVIQFTYEAAVCLFAATLNSALVQYVRGR